MNMKLVFPILVSIVSQNVFASSVCVITAERGVQTEITCEGKAVNAKEDGPKGSTLALMDLLGKGYRLVGTNSIEKSIVYTLVHD